MAASQFWGSNMGKRRKKNRTAKYIIAVATTVAILLMIYIAVVFAKSTICDLTAELSGPYEVVRVVDGDTIIVDISGEDTRVRLIGIDTPESVADESVKENTEEGKEASEYTTNLLEGKTVYLEYDQEILDEYGRTLCYVYLHDRNTMVNEILLKNGYARTMTIEPNTKYKERLAAAELFAKETKTGFWKTGFFH